jgi:hypothetical protein
MTLQSSGAISLSNLATEFSDTAPHSFSEFYKAGSLVPATIPDAVTASNLGGSNSTNARSPAIGGYDPQINTFSRLYTQALWGDNGSTISFDRNFTVNKTGTYNYYIAYYIENAQKTATFTFYVNGSQVATHSLTAGPSAVTTSTTGTLSVTANQVIRVAGGGGSSGWAVCRVYIGGSTYDNSSIDLPVNTSVPTSGIISLSNFYGARVS